MKRIFQATFYLMALASIIYGMKMLVDQASSHDLDRALPWMLYWIAVITGTFAGFGATLHEAWDVHWYQNIHSKMLYVYQRESELGQLHWQMVTLCGVGFTVLGLHLANLGKLRAMTQVGYLVVYREEFNLVTSVFATATGVLILTSFIATLVTKHQYAEARAEAAIMREFGHID